MAFSGGDWALYSNLFIAASILWLIYLRKDATYMYPIMLLGTIVLASSFYHVCWTSEREWCPGPQGHANEREISMARDIMAAFQAMGVALVPINEWLLHRYPPRVYAWTCILTSLATWVVVVAFSDGLETCIGVSVFWGLFGLVALMYDRSQGVPWSAWRWLRLLLGGGSLAAAAGVRAAAIHEFSNDVPSAEQSDRYLELHGMTHMLFGVGAFLILTTLHRAAADPPHTYSVVPLIEKMSGRVKPSVRK